MWCFLFYKYTSCGDQQVSSGNIYENIYPKKNASCIEEQIIHMVQFSSLFLMDLKVLANLLSV
jgi:hypothetical protein